MVLEPMCRADNDAHYISAQNYAKPIIRLTKKKFAIERKGQNLSALIVPDLWHLGKHISKNFTFSPFHPILNSYSTATITCISQDEHFTWPFFENSTCYA